MSEEQKETQINTKADDDKQEKQEQQEPGEVSAVAEKVEPDFQHGQKPKVYNKEKIDPKNRVVHGKDNEKLSQKCFSDKVYYTPP